MGPEGGELEGFSGLACPSILNHGDTIGVNRTGCLAHQLWCRKDAPLHCEYGHVDFLSNDPQVCKNASFWQEQPCEVDFEVVLKFVQIAEPKVVQDLQKEVPDQDLQIELLQREVQKKYKRCGETNPGRCIAVDSGEKCDEDLADQHHLNPADTKVDLDLLLPHCNRIYGNSTDPSPGLRCPKIGGVIGCLPIALWCQHWFQQDCGYGIVTTDPRICENVTFWEKISCPQYTYRCNGYFPGQCAGGNVSCYDGSDFYLEPLLDDGDCGERLKCQASLKVQLSEEDLQALQVNTTGMVCLDKALICDLYPQCMGGQDELECEEVYLEKEIFTKDQTFPCPNPYYNITLPDGRIEKRFTHRAIRCNADPECWGGEDEKGCNVVEITAQYVIRKLPPQS